MDKDRAVEAVLSTIEDADPEKLGKVFNTVLMTFFGAALTKRHVRKATGLDFSYGRVYHTLLTISWLSWFVSRNVTTGYLHARDVHEALKDGVMRKDGS